MDDTFTLTALERCLFRLTHERYGDHGAPDLASITCIGRTQNSAMRHTYIDHPGRLSFKSGLLTPSDGVIELNSHPIGLQFDIDVKDFKINRLSIGTIGTDGWDGSEDEWKLIGHSDELPLIVE